MSGAVGIALAAAVAAPFFPASALWYRWAIVPHGVLGMIAIGNPLLWWGSIAAVVGLTWAAWRQRDARLGECRRVRRMGVDNAPESAQAAIKLQMGRRVG